PQHGARTTVRDSHVGVRIGRNELVENGCKQEAASELHGANHNLARETSSGGIQLLNAPLDLARRKLELACKFRSRRIGADPGRRPVKERLAKIVFQVTGGTAQRCLRDPKSARGPGK